MPTPTEWLAVLNASLTDQQEAIRPFRDYYDGDHPLAYATAKYAEAFGRLFGPFADNWCQIIVDAAVERLQVVGFRFGQDQSDDREAWDIWQANALDSESLMAHTEAVKCGVAYLLVDPFDGVMPRITVEHPAEMVVAHEPGNRRLRAAALKRWPGDDGYVYANVYLPDAVHKFRSAQPRRSLESDWVPREWSDVVDVVTHRLGAVPVVPLYNNPDLLAGGQSDLRVAIPLQDAINKVALDLILASEFSAFKQRVMIGVEVPKDPQTGQPVAAQELKALQSRIWALENPDAKIGEFTASDLTNYTNALETLIQHLAAQTRTPPHYLLAKMVNLSGDALKTAETGLVARVKRKQQDFSEGWEEAIRLAFRARGDSARAGATDAETLWRDPENRTMGEMVDAAVKLRTIGVPLETLWEGVGYTPQQIERMRTLSGLPERPPPGATTAEVPPVLGGTSTNGGAQ